MNIERISLINPSLPPRLTFGLAGKLEEVREKARKEIVRRNTEKFDLDCFPLIPKHPMFVKYKVHEGLLSTAAVIESLGYRVEYLQQDFLEEKKRWRSRLKSAATNSEIVGITSYTPSYPTAQKVAFDVKQVNPNCRIVMGGPHVSFLDINAVKEGADIVVRGEGENVIRDLLQALEKGETQLEGVKGITYNSGARVARNQDAKPPDLDSLPTPAYHLVPQQLREMPIWTSRGCPYSCEFCIEKRMFRNVRLRNPEKVLLDLKEFQKCSSSKYVFIRDSVFPLSKKIFRALFKLIRAEKLDLYFGCQSRANLIDKELIDEMEKSNIVEVFMGMESASERILALMKKGETFNDYVDFARNAKNRIPFIITSWVVGYPGETYETIYETAQKLDFLHRNNLITDSAPRVFIPYPGTPQFHYPNRYDMTILTSDFRRYVRNTFPAVHRLRNLDEYEMWWASFQMFLIGAKHLVREADMDNEYHQTINNNE